jgi:tripartite-type tricarboxylate transporter receptor subunit TctC
MWGAPMTTFKIMTYVALLAVATYLLGVGGGQCAPYPSRPIKLINPFAAGGAGDIIARIVAERLTSELGKSVIVDARPGANGMIGATVVAQSAPDGYTILQVTPGNIISPTAIKDAPYDWQKDLTPIIGIGGTPLVLAVNGHSDIQSIDDLVKEAKSAASGILYSSGGTGSMSHLAAARFGMEEKINATHVPYRGLRPAVEALLSNEVQFAFLGIADVEPFLKSGDLRVLAITASERAPDLPNTLTMAELGIQNFNPQIWYGYVVPAKTPSDVVARLHDAIGKVVADPATQAKLGKLGLTVSIKNSEEFGKFMQEEADRWHTVIEANHIKLE